MRLFIAIVLAVIARSSLYLLQPLFVVWTLVRFGILNTYSLKKRGWLLSKYFYNVALSFDQTANAVAAPMFNDIMVKQDDRYEFGDADETLSYVYAVNDRSESLTWFGQFWAKFLDWVDKDHLLKAIYHNEDERWGKIVYDFIQWFETQDKYKHHLITLFPKEISEDYVDHIRP